MKSFNKKRLRNNKKSATDTVVLLVIDLVYLVIVIISIMTLVAIVVSQSLDSTDSESNIYPIYILTRCFSSHNNLPSSLIVLDLNKITQNNFDSCFYFGAKFPLGLNLTFTKLNSDDKNYKKNSKNKIISVFYNKNEYLLWKQLTDTTSKGGAKEVDKSIPIIINDNGKLINAIANFEMVYPNS